MTLLQTAGQTDVGRHRQDNQDTYIDKPLWSAHDALLSVIDGVGGYAGGAQAASLAKEAIVQYMSTLTGDTLTMLCEAVVHANNQIVRHREQDPALAHMCCVLTVAVVDVQARRLVYVHVGDTRLYRFRGQQLKKITHDHSLVGIREDANQLTEHEAMRHPRRNEILRDVGSAMHRVEDADFLESGETDFLPGDVLLLCSDGLTDMLTRDELIAVLNQSIPVEEQVTELIRKANEQGGQDNITVVLGQFPALLQEDMLTAPASPVSDDTSTPAPAPIANGSQTPLPARKWVRTLGVFLLLILLAGALWWQFGASRPATMPHQIRPDSSGNADQSSQLDSIRTP